MEKQETLTELESFELYQTGARPLKFKGACLAKLSDRGNASTTWHELEIYKTAKGKIVLHLTYRTRWEGDKDNYRAFIHESEKALVDSLDHFFCDSDCKTLLFDALELAKIDTAKEIE